MLTASGRRHVASHVATSPDGVNDLTSASVPASTERDAIADRAQPLALTTVSSAREVAADQALTALGRDGLVAVCFAGGVFRPLVRSSVRRQHIELNTIGNGLAEPWRREASAWRDRAPGRVRW